LSEARAQTAGGGREIFFAMKFSQPFDRIELHADGKPVADVSQAIRAKSLKAVIYYATAANERIWSRRESRA